MGQMGDINQTLRVATDKITDFHEHISTAPKDVTKQEAASLVKMIRSTYDQLPEGTKMAQVSTNVNRGDVKNMQMALKNLFNFLDTNPAIQKLVASLLGADKKREFEAFKKKVEDKRRAPKSPTLIKVVQVEKGELNKR